MFTIKTCSEMSASFTDSSAMKDGWILGPDSELLFWVPSTLRAGLLRPGNELFIGAAITTRLNLDSFVHGESWSLCKEPEQLSISHIPDHSVRSCQPSLSTLQAQRIKEKHETVKG
jgi:hypothetical protein